MGNSQTKGQPKGRQKKQVHWKAADRPGPPGKPQLVPGAELTPDVVTIKWDKPKHDGGTPITGYLVEHRRTGSPHWVRATPILVQVPELTLSGLEPGWRYQFRVTAQNIVGMSDAGETSEPLTVTLQRSVITAPKFTEELKDTTALENELTEFVVHVIGQPPPKICWFKDGFEIFSSRRTRIITENDKSVLTIHQVALTDEGEIKCTATNKAGHASTKAAIKVEAPPVIRLPRQYEDGLLFELDEVIRLKVSIAGRPQPLVFWSHNGESLQNDERYEITNTDKSSVLKVSEAKRTDRGEYQIRAVNTLGENSTSFLVTVTDKPQPPLYLKVIMSLGKTVTLSWEVPDDDGGCKIGTYIVEYYRIGWNVWLKASTCRQLTTTLSDLIEGSEYKFRVKAESPYGVSDPSDETDVIFIPDPKRGLLSPPARSRSLQRDHQREVTTIEPIPPKRRSTSSTRQSGREATTAMISSAPIPPKREKLKTPHRSPEQSPRSVRKDLSGDSINRNMFDRSSLAREITYGTDLKYKKPDNKQFLGPNSSNTNIEKNKTPSPIFGRERSSSIISQLFSREKDNDKNKTPSPFIGRERSPSIINQLISNFLPKKSPSPSPSPSPPSDNNISPVPPNNSPIPQLQEERNEPIMSSLKGDHLDRLSPNIVNRRLSSPMILNQRERSPSPMDVKRMRSPSLVESMLDNNINSNLAPMPRSKSPSPNLVQNKAPPSPNLSTNRRSPSPARYSLTNEDLLQRNSFQNNNDMIHGSSEFMLVLVDDHNQDEQEFMFIDSLIPPPMSLSAPELGATSDLFMPLKYAVSSSELLHERAFARFAKEAEEANNDIDKISLARKASFERKAKITETDERRASIPKILINSKDNEEIVGLERQSSFSRRLSAGAANIAQHFTWAKKRHSLRNTSDNTDLYDIKSKFSEKNKDISQIKSLPEETENTGSQNDIEFTIKNISIDEEIYSEEEEEEEESEDERLKEDIIPPNIKHTEEETYSPRMKTPIMSSKYEEPFEILTKPSPLPDPNFIPRPILKRKEIEDHKKLIPEKPARKSVSDIELRPQVQTLNQPAKSRSPSPIRSSSPDITKNIQTSQMISAAEAARNKRMNRQSSQEEEKVVADKYMDLVREYSLHNKPQHSSYFNRELLRAAAAEENAKLSSEESLQNIPKRQPSPVRTTMRNRSKESTRGSKRNASPCPARRPIPDIPTENKMIGLRTSSQTRDTSRRRDTSKTRDSSKTRETSRRDTSKTRTRNVSKTRDAFRGTISPTELEKLILSSRTPSPRPLTPEQEAMQVEIKVRSTVDYLTDVAMFIVACWLYLFKDARLAIPILIIMVYRQLKDEVRNMIPAWMIRTKKTENKNKNVH